MLTSQAPGHFSMRCMQAGAAGYVCKQQDLTELLSAIKAMLSGYSHFPNQALNSVRSTQGNTSEADMVERLSGREMMVLQQLAQGKTNKEIADRLGLSAHTTDGYTRAIYEKLHVNSRSGAVAKAMRSGFRSGLRGYFAPLHKAPWRAAWCAYQDPAGRWWSPLAAWVSSIERITFGPSPSSSRDRERNGPVA